MSLMAIVYFFPNEAKFKYEFQKGKPWRHKDLIAPTAFPIQKSQETIEKERNEVLKDLRPYFVYKEKIYKKNRSELIRNFSEKWSSYHPMSPKSSRKFKQNKNMLLRLYDSIGNRGLLEITSRIKNQYESNSMILVKNKLAEERSFDYFFTPAKANQFIARKLKGKNHLDSSLIANTIQSFLQQNIVFDPGKTKQERKNLLSSISRTRRMVQKGELIVAQGEPVDKETYRILVSLKKDYEEDLAGSISNNSIVFGQIILATLIMLVMVLFLYFFWNNIFDNNRNILLILLLLILMVFLISWTTQNFSANYVYLVPVCIVPIVIRSFFDTRLAFFIHMITTLILSLIVPNSFEFIFLQLVAGTVTIFTIIDLQKRSQFFITSIFIFLSYSVTYLGISLLSAANLKTIEPAQFAFFAGSALITMFSYPLVFIFEKLLGLITDVSLMEYSDTNSKLLRRLAETAPGTFQHSIQVANLGEEVTYKIGGSALLVRTGALYHDIGKMKNSMYFIENQNGNYNPHNELSNSESARILIGHVPEGIEMAKKFNLPEQIIDFIRTHHGIRKVDYFYNLERKKKTEEEIDIRDFQYHGPVPFSKETAVIMMADSVEAASRSMKNPSEKNINQLVDNIINKQMNEFQFINSDITFSDITSAKKILKRKLHNIYHVRIEYPE